MPIKTKLPKPGADQVRIIREKARTEHAAAMAALNRHDWAAFRKHSAEARVCQSWLDTYVPHTHRN